MTLSPIERMIDRVAMFCTICGAAAGTCGCWTECRCGIANPTGEECRNPVHGEERAAEEFAEHVALNVVEHMKAMYPEPMKHASGGFRKTLSGTIKREVRACILEVYKAESARLKDTDTRG